MFFLRAISLLFFTLNVFAAARAQNAVVPDSTEKITVADIIIQGNRRTKDYIITREVTFKKGDTLSLNELNQKLDRSQKNIFNTAMFNEVKMDAVKLSPGQYHVFISVKERWYIIPSPVFELYDRNYKEWWNTYNHDIRRVTYGIRFSHRNFSGRRDKLDVFLITGFSKQVLLRYSQPFTDAKLRHGFSVSGGYSEKIGESYEILGNTFMPRDTCRDHNGDGKPDRSGDSCVNFREFGSTEKFLGVGYTYRKGIYATHSVNLSIMNKAVADTIARLNPQFFGRGRNHETYFGASYQFSYSKLDYNPYPLTGQYFIAGAQAKIARRTTSQVMLYGYLGKYFQIVPKLFFSTQLSGALRFPADQSFYNLRSSSLQIPNLRGLEQYAILGTAEANFKNTVRFRLLDKLFKVPVFHIRNHEYIPVKLYLKAFTDLGYAHLNKPNARSLNNTLLRTAGFGLDIVTLYDLNLRIDFSFNQLGQSGFYFK